jgi:prepilin-type N-terminal cleavage/methylation domain-containing protein
VSSQEGFTLIELLAAIVVLVIGITAVAQVFDGTLRANGSADVRTRATAIAGREVEAMRSQPYASVGLPTGSVAANWTDPLDNGVYSVVFVNGSSISPTGSDVAGAVPVTIQRKIVWSASSPNNQAYKRVVAMVSWTDSAGTHTVRQDSDVYPGGLGPYASTTTTGSTTTTTAPLLPGAPTNLTATQDASNPTSQIDLSWTAGSPAATAWEIQHSLTNTFASYTDDTTTQPGSSTTYAKTGLAANTTFWFRVRALDPLGNASLWSNYVSAATATTGSSCAIGTANATPGAQNRANNGNGHLTSSIYVQVHTSGNCSTLSLIFTPGVSQGQVTTALVPESGGVYDYTIGTGDYSWDVGSKSINVVDPGHNIEVLATIALTICSQGASHCP